MQSPELILLEVHADDRGSLFEVLHSHELPRDVRYPVTHPADLSLPWPGPPPRFGQVYVVRSPARGTIRGFHRHQWLWDYFCVVKGRAKVVCVEPIKTEAGYRALEIRSFVLCEEKPAMLVIPPGQFHGWAALTDGVILLSIGSELYNREQPDEERIPFDTFGDLWSVQPK